MNATTELPNYSLAPALGSVTEATMYGVDVYVAGTNDRIVTDTSVTIRQAKGIPGWVGTIDADVTAYADIKLELHRPGSATDRAVLFTVGGGLQGHALIRGTTPHLVPLE